MENDISDPTLVYLTNNFIVLYTNMKVYIIIRSGWSLAWIFMKEKDNFEIVDIL